MWKIGLANVTLTEHTEAQRITAKNLHNDFVIMDDKTEKVI